MVLSGEIVNSLAVAGILAARTIDRDVQTPAPGRRAVARQADRGSPPGRPPRDDVVAPGVLDDQLQGYLDHLAIERGVAANTLSSYRRDLRRYVAHLDVAGRRRHRQGRRGRRHATSWCRCASATKSTATSPLSAVSAARALIAVRGFHRFAAAEGLATVDVARAVKPPTPSRRLPKSIGIDEVVALLDGAGGDSEADGPLTLRNRALLEVLYSTGARISEAVGLDVDDVDTHSRSVLLRGKGGKQRLVPIGRPAVGARSTRTSSAAGPTLARRGKGTAAIFLNVARRTAVAAERLAGAAGRRRTGGHLRVGVTPHAAALVRDAPARGRRRRARRAGAARARVGHHDADLHAGHGECTARGVGGRASPRALIMGAPEAHGADGNSFPRRGRGSGVPDVPFPLNSCDVRQARWLPDRWRSRVTDDGGATDGAGATGRVGLTGRPPRPIPEPKPRSVHGPAKVIAMCNQKGGVGKTTSTINLGASLAEYGRRVLLVDLDPQGALSAGLGVPHYELDHTVHNLLIEPRVSIDDVLIKTRVKGLDLVPSNIDLSAAEIQLVNEVGREHSLSRALHPVLDRYDYVLIDCQPSLGPADGQRVGLRGQRHHSHRVRVLLAARPGAADRHRRPRCRTASIRSCRSAASSSPGSIRAPSTPAR